MKRVGIFCGGNSREREISLRSGKNVQKALQAKGYETFFIDPQNQLLEQIQKSKIEVAYLALHGKGGEDGVIQGFLESMNIPYTGSGVNGSAVTINKVLTKMVLQASALPTPEFQVIRTASDPIKLDFPLVLKPQEEGSSLGVSIHHSEQTLRTQLEKDLPVFGKMFLEKFVSGKEVTVGVLGWGQNLRALPILELVPKNEFYDFEAKYTAGKTNFIVPANLEKSVENQIKAQAVLAHQSCGCHGVSRVDFIVENDIYPTITEINAIPGMTELSDLPAEAKAAGISFEDLVEEILNSAWHRIW